MKLDSGRLFLKFLMFWLPIPATIISTLLWYMNSNNNMIVIYATFMPLLYGYTMPFVAINILNKWRFKKGIMIGGMYVHHGFMYAWKMSICGFIPFWLIKNGDVNLAKSFAWISCSTLPYAFIAWLQDSLSVKYQYVEFGSVNKNVCVKKNITLSYAPSCFTTIGFIYSSGLVLIYKTCMTKQCSLQLFFLIFFAVFILLSTLPAVVYNFSLQSENKK